MKKIRILFIVAVVALLFAVPCAATESVVETVVEDSVVETTAQTTIETTIETVKDTETDAITGEVIELPDDLDVEGLRAYWESFKENISKLSVWLIAFFSTSGVAIMGCIVKWGIKKIIERIVDNARKSDDKIDKKLEAHTKEIMAAVNNMTDELKNDTANMDKMFEIMSIFIMNSNEPASSKAEMMEMMMGFKKYDGNLADVVRQAQEDIEKHREEKVAMQSPTPELDALIEEKNK